MRLIIPTAFIAILCLSDRLAPGYGVFAIKPIAQPISKVFDSPKDCSRAMSKAEFNTLKRMSGATRAELSATLAGAFCETGIRLDFSKKRLVPKMVNGRFDGVVTQ